MFVHVHAVVLLLLLRLAGFSLTEPGRRGLMLPLPGLLRNVLMPPSYHSLMLINLFITCITSIARDQAVPLLFNPTQESLFTIMQK